MSEALRQFLAEMTARIAPVETEANLAYWEFTTTGSQEAEARFKELQAALRRIYADRASFEQLKRLTEGKSVDDPVLARQATLLHYAFLGNQMDEATIQELTEREVAIASTFNTFRADLNGRKVTENEIKDILKQSDDLVLRRQAWEASKQIGGQVAGPLVELVKLRNRIARQSGFDDYYHMQLVLQELNEREVFDLFEALDRQVSSVYQAYKARLDSQLARRFGIAVEELRPWHYSDPFFQEAPAVDPEVRQFLTEAFANQNVEELVRRFFRAVGLEVDDVLARSDLYEREGKQQHAYCIHIDRKGDIRVLANVQPNHYWTSTMLHECGHAVYEKHLDTSLPYLLRQPAHILLTEAVAMLMGRLADDADWLTIYAGVPERQANALAERLRWQMVGQVLITARWVPVMSHFERALYRDANQDLNQTWWELEERFQRVPRPDGRRNEPDWAAKIHLGTAPVYYHNYLLGELVASQLQHTVQTSVLAGSAGTGRRYVTDPLIGQYLIERIFRPGAIRHWQEALEFATGERLRPDYFVEQVRM